MAQAFEQIAVDSFPRLGIDLGGLHLLDGLQQAHVALIAQNLPGSRVEAQGGPIAVAALEQPGIEQLIQVAAHRLARRAIERQSGAPGSVTNREYASSTGVGLRLGYQGRLSDTLTIGAAYAPKMSMGEFDKYKGLFAESGGFDIPSHYSIGVAFMPTPALTIAVDIGRINYSDARSVNNPSVPPVAPLGAANGPGFGWQDIDVFKLGVAWRMSDALTLRAGYNKGQNPITARDVTFNILAPGVVEDHYTLGFTYALDQTSEISGSYMHARRNSVTGASFFNAFAPGMGGNETIEMYQNSLGIAWAKRW